MFANLVDPSPSENPLTRDRAVMHLLGEAGTVLDPLFTRLFVKAIGVFPVGCMVRMSDQSVGVVSAPGADALTPTVRLLYDPAGMTIEDMTEVDLAETGMRILEVVEAESLNVEVSDHL